MHLKSDCNIADFISSVKQCEGEVLFTTSEGDSLNLKSLLSQHLFASISTDSPFIIGGNVLCKREKDYNYLTPFLADES